MPFPWSLAANLAIGGVQGILGGAQASSSNRQARKAAKAQRKQSKQDWRYTKRQIRTQNKYNNELYKAQIENDETMRQYDFDTQMQRYDYGMGIREYEFDQQMRVFDQQVKQKDQQLSFNMQAFNSAINQQNLARDEAMLGFKFDDYENAMNMRFELGRSEMSKKQADAQQRGLRANAAFESNQTMVAGLEAEGAARGSGQSGRTAAKNVQAAIIKNAAQEAAIAEGVTQAGFQYQLSIDEITQNLNQAYETYALDRAAIAASRNSFDKADMALREQINQDFQQANMNAINAVMLEPEIAPELPRPEMRPAIKYVKPFEIPIPDEPIKGAVPQTDVGIAQLSGLLGGTDWGAVAGGVADLFNNPINVGGGSDLFNLDKNFFN